MYIHTHEDKVYAGICIYVNLPWLSRGDQMRRERIQNTSWSETRDRDQKQNVTRQYRTDLAAVRYAAGRDVNFEQNSEKMKIVIVN